MTLLAQTAQMRLTNRANRNNHKSTTRGTSHNSWDTVIGGGVKPPS